jgi:cardiolipin synthase A/B
MSESEQTTAARVTLRRTRPRRHYRGVSKRIRNTYGRNVRRIPKGVPGLYARVRRLLWSWWAWAILAVVLAYLDRWKTAPVAGILAFVAYVTMPRELPPLYGLDHNYEAGSDEFLATITGATGVEFIGGNTVEIYDNGDRFYPVMLEAIERAERSITIEAYIYWAGSIGRRFAEALAAQARNGVQVKILLDAIGSASIGDDLLKILTEGGCQIAWYHPIRWYTVGRFNNRTHRKSLIIDGRIGFTGGAGIADHWQGDAQDPDHWRDTQIRLEGPGVAPLQTAFAQNWLETTGELVNGWAFYPEAEPVGNVAVQTVLSSPETGASAVRIMYYLSIVCARKSIWIANPYFVPDQVAHDILVDAKKRGVDVKVIVAGRWNDSRLARFNGTRLYGELLACGVEIYEYERTMLHHKVMIVDNVWGTIGTTNFDNRSFSHNAENNVCFMNPAAVGKLKASFVKDLEACRKMDLESWRRRPLWIKGFEGVASLLQDQV